VDAASHGDTIKVAQGVYTGQGYQVVYIDKAITLRGGYATTNWDDSIPAAQPSVIDAENAARRRGLHVHGTNALTITLDGFTIQGGNSDSGGGIYVPTGTLMLKNSRVLANRHSGVHVENGTVALANNTFDANHSQGFGGALCMTGGSVT
jgi:predicted outer membrane repeat protein